MPEPDPAIKEEDFDREKITGSKIWLGMKNAITSLRPTNNQAIVKISKFELIDIAKINKALSLNIRAVILDIDETVTEFHSTEIPKQSIQTIKKMVQQGIKIIIYSNRKYDGRYDELIKKVKKETGYTIEVMKTKHSKPHPDGFNECYERIKDQFDPDKPELQKNEMAMIGDNPTTDGGSVRAGIQFIQVEAVKNPKETFKQKLKPKRAGQILLRKIYIALSRLFDIAFRRKPLKDKDLSQ